mmetsp:Transcript_38250/g.78052  ORF Transcript_38250/g.78052 Transcript_38250/m.78052 type:complete len:95 (+) Transcript_38250:1770-2054(+)
MGRRGANQCCQLAILRVLAAEFLVCLDWLTCIWNIAVQWVTRFTLSEGTEQARKVFQAISGAMVNAPWEIHDKTEKGTQTRHNKKQHNEIPPIA